MKRAVAPYVYFVRQADGGGPVKIGCSQAPEARLSSLMTWAPFPLVIAARTPGDEAVERRFHAMFAAQHSHREWFHPSAELDAVIAAVNAGDFDVSALPAPQSLMRTRAGKPWSDLTRARVMLSNRLRKLRDAGQEIPADIWRCTYGYYTEPEAQQWERIERASAFLAEAA